MAEINELWQKRRSAYWKMTLRYWNLIGKNSGLMFALYILVIVGGFYYKQWLSRLSPAFPGALVISLVIFLFAVHAPIRTFVRQADIVFLLPIEAEMDGYFRKSKVYSFFIQSASLAALLIIVSPLYFRSVDSRIGAFVLLAAAAFAVKAWNIDCRWCEQYIDERLPLNCLRVVLSFLFIYAAASGRSYWLLIVCAAVMLAGSVFLFHRQAKAGLLKWERLLEMENKQMMQFLHFANLFTDVPILKRKVHPRGWLNGLLKIRSFAAESVFKQLFLKTFVRAGDYFGLYVRLTVVGSALVFFLKNGYYTVFIIAAVVFLTALQLIPLWKHPLPQALAGLYPIAERVKQRNFVQILFWLLIGQTAVLSAAGGIAVRSSVGFLLFLAAGAAVAALVVYGYVNRKIAAEQSLPV